jgi:hypothetical protein
MPDSAGKRQRREVKAKKQRARDERRTARNERREDRAARGADGQPIDDWLSDEPVVRDIGADGPGAVDEAEARRRDGEPERAERT